MITRSLYRWLTVAGLGLLVLLAWLFVSSDPTPDAAVRHFLRTTMTQAMSMAMLMLGLFFFTFWLARRSETEYLLLAVASVVWALSNLQFVLARPADPVLRSWFKALLEQLPIAWLNWLVFQFYACFLPRRPRRLETALAVYVLLASALALPVWGDVGDTSLWATTVYTTVGIGSIVVMVRQAFTWRRPETTAMAAALLVSALAGAHDWALRAQWLPATNVPLIPYTGLLLFSTFLFAVQRRYVGAIQSQEGMSAELAARLSKREQQLTDQHRHLLELERAHAQTVERQRLMRDMHDGLGAHLGAALMLAEQGRLGQGDQLQTLRAAVDDLRAVIDSLAAEGQDLADVWAAVRYRWNPRLQAAGLQVHWPLVDVPAVLPLQSAQALDLQRWLHEALANVLKHAQASQVAVTLTFIAQELCITVQDDGVGFDTGQARRLDSRGLGNLALRAERLGARFTMRATVGEGVVLSLEWTRPSGLCSE